MFTISILYFGLTYMIIYLIGKNRDIANKDYLTKLPNRKKFEEVLEDKLLEANRKKSKVVILFLDLNKFKEINDKFGHGFGDEVLIKVGDRIRNTIPKKDIVSRIGGDEFVSLVSGIGSKEEIMKIASVVSDAFEAPFNINSIEVDIKPSIGISIYPDHGDQIAELILKADDAMYESKEKHIKYKIYKNENI